MGIKEAMVNGGEIAIVESAVRICRGYLPGKWKTITSQDISVVRQSGGNSNHLYRVQLNKPCEGTEPKQVLLRIYGQNYSDNAVENLITESVIFTLLSERKIGPKLYGLFPGGRIEELLDATSLTSAEMSDPTMASIIAERVAEVHRMNVPISKRPKWIWDTLQRWVKTLDKPISSHPIEKELLGMNLDKELEWMKSHLSKIHSPVVFCHNDLNSGNILKHNQHPKVLTIIDFEYCAYNYRGFELANHFLEYAFDLSFPVFPYFQHTPERACTSAQMRMFVEKYLNCLRGAAPDQSPEINNVDTILREVKHYALASHLLWGLWAIVCKRSNSTINFGFWEYARSRLNLYFELKKTILANQKDCVNVKRKASLIEA